MFCAPRIVFTALEPLISEETLRAHHLGHHAGYTTKLNAALAELRADPATKPLAKMGIDTLLQHLDDVPEEGNLRTRVRNFGGGYVNHQLFFDSMAPKEAGAGVLPSDESDTAFATAVRASFDSFDSMIAVFKQAATSLFGSGYAWLVHDARTGGLSVTTSVNQETPASVPGVSVLLVVDVWEHAYYLDQKWLRPQFVDAFVELIDWAEVEARYAEATSADSAEL